MLVMPSLGCDYDAHGYKLVGDEAVFVVFSLSVAFISS